MGLKARFRHHTTPPPPMCARLQQVGDALARDGRRGHHVDVLARVGVLPVQRHVQALRHGRGTGADREGTGGGWVVGGEGRGGEGPGCFGRPALPSPVRPSLPQPQPPSHNPSLPPTTPASSCPYLPVQLQMELGAQPCGLPRSFQALPTLTPHLFPRFGNMALGLLSCKEGYERLPRIMSDSRTVPTCSFSCRKTWELRCSNSVITCSFCRLNDSRIGVSGTLFQLYRRSHCAGVGRVCVCV
jgi:hypothetical protein